MKSKNHCWKSSDRIFQPLVKEKLSRQRPAPGHDAVASSKPPINQTNERKLCSCHKMETRTGRARASKSATRPIIAQMT
jgi:hypothetical protein